MASRLTKHGLVLVAIALIATQSTTALRVNAPATALASSPSANSPNVPPKSGSIIHSVGSVAPPSGVTAPPAVEGLETQLGALDLVIERIKALPSTAIDTRKAIKDMKESVAETDM